MGGRVLRWTLALLPAAVGLGLWTAARTGLLPDERLRVSASALRSDWLLLVGVVLSGLLLGLALVAARRDAVWRRRLADQSAAAAQDRRLLMSRLDHELKNPLTAMRAALANVSADAAGTPGNDARKAGLASLEAQVLRLSRLTADLRKIADVRASDVDRRPMEVADLLDEALEVAREHAEAGNRVFSVDLPRAPWPLPSVVGDVDLLSLAVVNLVDNAIKYTGPGDRIEVRAREAAGSVIVEVADTGPGIPAEDLEHVWEELYRSPSARTVPGSGLGLALVRAVVEQHGGTVAAESRIGQGTVVRIQLPAGG